MEIAYKVEGLRSIMDMPYIDLKPITILVGLNNSGKSTFLQSLPLLNQSMSLVESTPIQWSDGLVDFGDFSTSSNRQFASEHKKISFSFKISELSLNENYFRTYPRFAWDQIKVLSQLNPEVDGEYMQLENIEYTVALKESCASLTPVISEIAISVQNIDFKFELQTHDDGVLVKGIKFDGQEFSDFIDYSELKLSNSSVFLNDLIFSFDVGRDRQDNTSSSPSLQQENYPISNLLHEINDMMITKNSPNSINVFPAGKVSKNLFDSMSQQKQSNGSVSESFGEFNRKIDDSDRLFLQFLGKFVLFRMVLDGIFLTLESFLIRLKYLGSTRIPSLRLNQLPEAEIVEIDANGQNLSQFFANLDEVQLKEFSQWVSNTFSIGVDIIKTDRHAFLTIQFRDDDTDSVEMFNIVDTGQGISQVLPILMRMWWTINRPSNDKGLNQHFQHVPRTVLVEQPELHLHPQLQANLANAIVSIATSDSNDRSPSPKFIVETHSEKLVSRLSDLIYRKEISHNDVQVVMFSSNSQIPINSNVEIYNFDEEGVLKDWPYGFFNSS